MDKEKIEELTQLLKDDSTKERAFSKIVDMTYKTLWNQAYSILKSKEDAEDAIQNAYLKAWLSIDRFRGDSSIVTWLYRIVINCSLTAVTKRKNQEQQLSADTLNYELNKLMAPITVDSEQVEQALQAAIEILPEKQKEVFQMRYYDALPYEEISRICGTSVGALKASYHHASKKIESYIESLEIDSY